MGYCTSTLSNLVVLLCILPPMSSQEDCAKDTVVRGHPPDISLRILGNATLFTAPGTSTAVHFVIGHHGFNSSTVMVSYREDFPPVTRPGGRHQHTYQVVSVLKPDGLVSLEAKSQTVGEVVLNLPSYAQEWTQIKITLSVQKRKRPYTTYEKSFYFTVFAGDNLKAVDSQAPTCTSPSLRMVPGGGRQICCQWTENGDLGENCNRTFYSSRLLVTDGKTGLRSVNVTSPGSMLTSDFVIGSASQKEFRIWTDCCHHGVEIRARDVAGNEAKCVIGINPNKATSTFGSLQVILVAIVTLSKISIVGISSKCDKSIAVF